MPVLGLNERTSNGQGFGLGGQLKVLLAIENSALRKSFRGMLSARFPDLEFQEALGPEDVLELARTHVFPLVFVDMKLAQERVTEFAKRIKDVCASSCVVILASYDLPEYREAALSLGADYLICKDKDGLAEIEMLIQTLCPGA